MVLSKTMRVPLLDLTCQYKLIRKEIDQAVKQVLESGNFILGENVSKLEQEFATYCGAKYAAGVANGTDALELSLTGLGIGKGDLVITTPFTFVATVEAIVSAGARPLFVDINLDTYNIDPAKIEECLRKAHSARRKTIKAIIPVHLYGLPCDMGAIMRLAGEYNLKVIEDCAQAAGAEVRGQKSEDRGQRVGSFGDCGCFSFFPTKNLGAYGDGGMVVTNDKKVDRRLRMLRAHGAKDKYHHILKGRNSRLDELQSAILRIKLRRLDSYNSARRHNARIYSELLSGLSDSIVVPHCGGTSSKHIYHLYVIRTNRRDGLRDFLNSHRISTGLHYPVPVHLEEAYRFLGYKKGDFPNAEHVASEVISLPMYPELDRKQIQYIVSIIKKWLSV